MRGAISAGHHLTADAGIEMFDRGGNAFDAAVAAAFVSFVCESPLTSMGGGGFFMAHSKGGETLLYDFFPNVPGLGRIRGTSGLDFAPVAIDFTGTVQEFHVGRGSAAVPGCMAGFAKVHEIHCTLPLDTILAPAIRLASEGFTLNTQQAYFHKILAPILTLTDEGRKVYTKDGALCKEGDMLFMREMADTMEYLAREGLRRFYDGEIAGRIVETFGNGGLITRDDLRNYKATVRRPLEVAYRGRRIFLNPPPSSGGTLIGFSLRLLQRHDIAALNHNGPQFIGLLSEVMNLTDTARTEVFDERIYEEGIADGFLSEDMVEEYAKRTAALLSPRSAIHGTGSTTHISVVDDEGNAASVTTSNGEGCGHMIPGTGVMLNNMLGEDDINPHGFHTQRPGLRMSSMMAPTIVMRGEGPEAVLGSGGSNRIRNAILQVIVNLMDHDLPVDAAVNAPRVHHDRAVLQAERGIDPGALARLEQTGVPVNLWQEKNMYFGGVHTVVIPDDGRAPDGAGDCRRGGVCLSTGGVASSPPLYDRPLS